ncbi:alpha/beta fold hydrolase [Streptomyces sp. NBC_00986]|uniref:alpha/beta fold hydrolase n=1 Tax=Streptomyces sp. NBC_00986 TaxID=2903702 RepID=UPI00386877A8|nr:alpha/beta hydrolase [Streptomyces sp. NBC_00986]
MTRYHTLKVDDLEIFYRGAGPPDAPALLLLHGFPSSSRMYEPLLGRLADRWGLIAPDLPGFGHSSAPAPTGFAYTFDHLAEVMNGFVDALGLQRYTLLVQDYGGPVGFRMAMAHPERLEALIIQNAVAHESGLGPLWQTRRAFWSDRATHEPALRENFLSLAATRGRHLGNDPATDRYDPDLWTDEYAFLNRLGQAEIQLELFYDYRTNLAAYPVWQQWLRTRRPRTLVLWGRHDASFRAREADSYRADLPDAEIHLLDGGHFVLDTCADEAAERIRAFLT